ncbi:MAG: hypothetical protein HY543_10725 [Deltaproteobacteria bacterium]|nr:hypothetical protein [Deltaproteobacteria bacterium]
MIDATRHAQWYGYYRPGVTPVPAEARLRRSVEALHRPIRSPSDVQPRLTAVADILPVYKRVVTGMARNPAISIVLTDGPLACKLDNGVAVLKVPDGIALIEYLFDGSRIFAHLAIPPEGIVTPAAADGSTPWERYFWYSALAFTFFCQAAHECSVLPLTTETYRGGKTILIASDLVLFRVLREEGLNGVARMLPRMLPAQERRTLEARFRERAGAAPAEAPHADGAATRQGMPPLTGRPPPLQRTDLDDDAETLPIPDLGFMTAETTYDPVDPADFPRLDALLNKRRPSLAEVLEVIRISTPRLYRVIGEPFLQDPPRLRLEFFKDRTRPIDTVSSPIPLNRCLDQAPTPETIAIHPEVPMVTVLPQLIVALARMAGPRTAYPQPNLSLEGDEARRAAKLATMLERDWVITELWARSAFIEYTREQDRRGLYMPSTSTLDELGLMIRECGLSVACEHPEEFLPAETIDAVRRLFRAAAERHLRNETEGS